MIDVTVGIAAYNSADFIEQAVRSVLSQQGPSFEIIVVDDESTDNTAALVEQIAQRDHRVRVHRRKNQGLGASRNYVLSEAKGRYIHFMDGDDYMAPHFLDALVTRADAMKADVTISSYYEVSQNDLTTAFRGLFVQLAHTHHAFNWIQRPVVLLSRTPVWDKLYRREFLLKNDISFIEGGAEDIPFSWQTLVSARRIGTVWTPYFYYRVRQGSLTGGLRLVDDVFEAVQTAETFLKQEPEWEHLRPYFVGRSICEIGYLIQKARSGFAANPGARKRYFKRLIRTFQDFDTTIPPEVTQFLDPLYVDIYQAVRGGLKEEELDMWFETHVSPYAPRSRKSAVMELRAERLNAYLRFGVNKLLGRV